MATKKEQEALIETYGELFPEDMGKCADLLFKLDVERKGLTKKAKDIEERQIKLRKWLIDRLPKSMSGLAGKLARITIDTKEVTQVKDWENFYAYILKKKRPDLLQRRPAEAAIEELLENGEDVPGIEKFRFKAVSVKKL